MFVVLMVLGIINLAFAGYNFSEALGPGGDAFNWFLVFLNGGVGMFAIHMALRS